MPRVSALPAVKDMRIETKTMSLIESPNPSVGGRWNDVAAGRAEFYSSLVNRHHLFLHYQGKQTFNFVHKC
jgi:hypothetical protein